MPYSKEGEQLSVESKGHFEVVNMLFEIQAEEPQKVLEVVHEFIKEAETVYAEEIPKAKEKVKALQFISPTSVNVDALLPDEMMMMAYDEDNKVYLKIAMYMPRVIKWLGKHKTMEKNLQAFLKYKGIDNCKIKFKGD